jgi:alkanesulfonate monooxygenase SsuD/methylene tetrahydromethanopterin reductase-like flavin-dependent oxidoreductase (luciferase family)
VADSLRFGCVVLQNQPAERLVQRWREVEALGFDSLWIADGLGSRWRPDWPWLDGWTCLGAMARETSRIRIGSLVSSIALRPPAALAKQAVTVDRLSGGRLELGVGAGGSPLDDELVGVPPWPAGERGSRFREYVQALDALLRGEAYSGQWYAAPGTRLEPPPVQSPRPPLTIAASRPGSIRLAAEHGDAWNTMGGRGLSAAEGLTAVREQSRLLTEACAAVGRDAAGIRRSLLYHESWIAAEPFSSEAAFRDFVDVNRRQAGIDEFVFHYPPEEWGRRTRVERGLLEHLARDVLPELRSAAG